MCLMCALIKNEIDMDTARDINNSDIRETYDTFYDSGMDNKRIIAFFTSKSWDKMTIENEAPEILRKYREKKAERDAINADVGIVDD